MPCRVMRRPHWRVRRDRSPASCSNDTFSIQFYLVSMSQATDSDGNRIIAASKRPDGTMRKALRVRDGYVPLDEREVYVSRGAAVSVL